MIFDTIAPANRKKNKKSGKNKKRNNLQENYQRENNVGISTGFTNSKFD